MSWPLSHDFNEAVQNPQTAFADADLKGGESVVGATGLPLPRSGNFADVYQVRGADGRDWAVKCFTRPVVGLGDRYARISEALARANLPFAVGFTFLAEGIRVGGVWRPVVKMEWVEGLLLNQVVRENAAKPTVLAALGQMWVKLCKRLRDAGIAHADLQHGNVLLVPGSRAGAFGLKLIDYDGVYVPALANTPSGESGHPSFQHPARAATRAYSPDVDRFPHLVVATALRGLAVGGAALWERYDNGDNLLFTEEDYKKPSASKAMRELWQTEDPALQALVGRLAIACGKPIPQTPWLDQFAPDGEPTLFDDAARREATQAIGITRPVPVSLPPEPAPVPVPLPPAPTRKAAPSTVDVELVEDTRPANKKRKPKEPAKSPPVLLLGGALLLLVVGVIGGVLLFRGKSKPDATVQQKPDEPKEPAPGEQGGPKPKDKIADPVVPKPKDPPTVVPQPPGKPRMLAPQWVTPLGFREPSSHLHIDDATKLVLAASYNCVGSA